MESIIQVFRMNEISIKTRIKIMMKLGAALNWKYGSNCTEELIIELILALDPSMYDELKKDERYCRYMK